jgi:hypothetical protein
MLDTLVIVGVFLSMLNLGEWLLRPHQKKAFEQNMESLTLTLHYTRPISWFSRLGERRFALAWTIISALFFFFAGFNMLGGALIFLVETWRNTLAAQSRIIPVIVGNVTQDSVLWVVYAYFAITLPVILATFYLLGQRITTYFSSSGRTALFIGRILGVYAATAAFAFTAMIGAIYFGRSLWYAFIGIPLLVVMPIPIVVVEIGLLMISLMLVLAVFEFILKLLRAVCWRIVEYSKGAWAAVIAILTAALGIYKVFLS